MLQRRRNIGITGCAGCADAHPSPRPLARRNPVIGASDYFANPLDDLIDHDINFPLYINAQVQVAVRASIDRIAAA